MEKVAIAKGRDNKDTIICRTRYGNVMGSRGSVIPLFLKQVEENKPITITNPNMTRFMMSLDEAVNLVLYAFEHGKQGDLFVQKSSSVTIDTLAKAIKKIKNSDVPIEYIGTRHGEKNNEVLITKEEMPFAKDLGNYYCVSPDSRNLNYQKEAKKKYKEESFSEYTSNNTKVLNLEETIELLKSLDLFN